MVAPRFQSAQGVIETEGERAEWPVGLVASAVGEQRAPEIVVEDVRPRRFGKQVRVGFDCTAVKETTERLMKGTIPTKMSTIFGLYIL